MRWDYRDYVNYVGVRKVMGRNYGGDKGGRVVRGYLWDFADEF